MQNVFWPVIYCASYWLISCLSLDAIVMLCLKTIRGLIEFTCAYSWFYSDNRRSVLSG